jgi:hypothetical protein
MQVNREIAAVGQQLPGVTAAAADGLQFVAVR